MNTRRKQSVSPLATCALAIVEQGYRIIPIMPKSKVPGLCSMGRWSPMTDWPQHKDNLIGPYQTKIWCGWEDAGIGVILGSTVAEGWELAALDFDTDDTMMLEIMESAVPASPVKKRGGRGFTGFYLVPAGTKGRRFKRGAQTICEILTGNSTRQTVIPPSIHPDTQQPYQWLTKETLATLPANRLPRLTEEMIDRFVESVEQFSDVREALGTPFVSTEEGSPHNTLNTMALQNLDKWVPDLRLDRCRKTSAGYVAVPGWRESMNGTPDKDRKPALGFSAKGIRDFSANVPHSPLDVVMLHNSWDLDLAFDWLASRVGYWEADDLGDFGPHSQRSAQQDAAQEAADPAESLPAHDPDTGELLDEEPAPATAKPLTPSVDPEALTHVPGLVGDVVDWIVNTARRPNRVLALGAAIAVVGTLMGRRIAGPTMSGTHLYIIALAPSGAGKDHPLRQIGPLLKAANAGHLSGPGAFMSLSGLVETLTDMPLCVCPMDEFGAFLIKITSPRASPHEKAITGMLREAWGSSFSAMKMPKYANRAADDVESPALSIYGTSTPGEFFDALQSKDVMNGFLNRFLMISTTEKAKDQNPKLNPFTVNPDLKGSLQRFYASALANSTEEIANPLDDYMPKIMPWADSQAEAEFEKFRDSIELLTEDESNGPFYARTVEMAVRLATIRAAGQDIHGAVNVADMKWGSDVAMASARQMIEAAGDHMAENDFARNGNTIVRLVKKSPKGCTRREFSQNLKGLNLRELNDVIEKLKEAGRIVEHAPSLRSGPGRPATLAVYKLPASAKKAV